jgi:glycerate-2-kinase
MPFIKNYPELAITDSRKIVLNLLEAGIAAIQFDTILSKNFSLDGDILHIQDKTYNLKDYDRVFLLAFGKGSAAISGTIEKTLKERITKGFVIDVSQAEFEKLDFTLGTHPLPSEANMQFSNKAVDNLTGLSEKDLVLIVICGGGSVLFDVPYKVDLTKLIEVNKALLSSGADIIEMNTIRKHLSKTKGGGLAGILHPAKVVSMIFSDVPGNDLSFIASGPTVRDETTKKQALAVYEKYNLQALNLDEDSFTETPKEDGVFAHVDNILLASNDTALNAMKEEAGKWGINAEILTDKFQSDAAAAGKTLIEATPSGSILLAGGETTVKVKGSGGKGGRNQHLVLSALRLLDDATTIVSFDSDGWDNTPAGGAVGDRETVKKAGELGLIPEEYLEKSDSFSFFESSKDAIITDRLPSNVADLIIVYKR